MHAAPTIEQFISNKHRRIHGIFQQIRSAEIRLRDQKNDLKPLAIDELFRQLEIEATIEREILYPAVRSAADEENSEREREALAAVEDGLDRHADIEQLISQGRQHSRYAEDLGSLLGEIELTVRLHFRDEEHRILPFLKQVLGDESHRLASFAHRRYEELVAATEAPFTQEARA
jgi:hemerythrin superfamily protein